MQPRALVLSLLRKILAVDRF